MWIHIFACKGHMQPCVHAFGSIMSAGVFLLRSLLYSDILSQLNPKLINMAILHSQLVLGVPVSDFEHWNYKQATTATPHFHGCWESECLSHVLPLQHLEYL